MSDPHTHEHSHDHTPPPDQDGPLTYYQAMEVAVRELLVEKGILTPEEVRREVEAMEQRTPANGARVVARAWTDPAYRERLLADGSAACAELGIDMGPTHLVVVADAPGVKNAIVCTLCSCYPRMLLGIPPGWYKARPYRSRMVREPRAVLAEFGLELPDDTVVRVHDSTADMRYMVLPERPAGTEGWTEEQLAGIVTRDCMVGVALPKAA